jgi:hypothetical protein
MNTTTISRFLATTVIGGLLILATGCGHNSIVGKWQGNVPIQGQTVPVTMEFKSDGTETQTASVQSPIGTMSIVANGTYTVKDTDLQMTQTSVTLNGRTSPAMPQATKVQTVPFKLDGDTLTLTPPNTAQPATLTRVKQ